MTQAPQKKQNTFLRFIVTFAIVYLMTSMALRYFLPEKFAGKEPKEFAPIELSSPKKNIPLGRNVEVKIQNRSESGILVTDHCPKPPVIIERVEGERLYQMDLTQPVLPCKSLSAIPPKSIVTVDLSPWKYIAFAKPGVYRISLPIEITLEIAGEEPISIDLVVKNPNIFVSLFRALISKPLMNGLILIASILPNHSLGWSIIILTLIVRLLLFFPSQHALESQKKMQKLQPKIEAIKKKHGSDQQKVTKETMDLWKREKINPFQSCLPTFIQIPILLGLFFIIRDSNSTELAKHLLYPPFLSLDWSFNTIFLGFLDMNYIPYASMNSWIPTPSNFMILLKNCALPLIIASMQFIQMKLTFAKIKKKDVVKKPLAERMNTQTMMMYMLPIMILFISGGLPAAVSMYWGTSTLFSIGQQIFVNKKKG